MGNLNFHEDIKIGQTNEQVVIDIFEREYNAICVGKSEKENGNLKEFDLIFNFPTKTHVVAEVKTEDKWVQPGRTLPNGAYFPGIDTGNLCIEFRMHGKDSGIMVTKSDLWVIVFMNIKEIWVIKTNKLRKLISEKNLTKYIAVNDTDWWPIFTFKDNNEEISLTMKTLTMQEMIKNGVLFNGTFVPCFSHSSEDVDIFITAFESTLEVYSRALEHGVEKYLKGPIIKPVFRKYI